jgi:hypothetical protein
MGEILKNTQKYNDKKLYNAVLAAIIIVLIIGIVARFVNITSAFSHYDDTGVAADILYAKEAMPKIISYFENPDDNTNTIFKTQDSYQFKIASTLYDAGLLRLISPLISLVIPAIAIGFIWSYAPLQFFLTGFLINSSQTYSQILLFGRLPSAIFSCLTLVAAFIVLKKYSRHNKKNSQNLLLRLAAILVCVAAISFSWQHLIYANHMSNYALGVLATFFILWLFVKTAEWLDMLSEKIGFVPRYILIGIALAMVSYAQHHTFPLVVAFFLGLSILHLRSINRKEFTKNLLSKKSIRRLLQIAAIGITYVIIAMPMFILAFSRVSWNDYSWNQGQHREFLYNASAHHGLAGKIVYTAQFFATNSFIVMRNFITPLEVGEPIQLALVCIFFTLTVLGIIGFFRKNPATGTYGGLIVMLCFAMFAIVVFTQDLTLSPTRHTLNLFPLALICVYEGLFVVRDLLNVLLSKNFKNKTTTYSNNTTIALCLIIFLILTASFILSFSRISEAREDKFDENAIIKVAQEESVDIIITESFIPLLMKDLNQNYLVLLVGRDVMLDPNQKINTILWITGEVPMNLSLKNEKFNKVFGINNSVNPSEYELVRIRESLSGITMDFDNTTLSGYNSIHIYTFKKN